MKELILASASPRRKELLTQIGLKFKVCSSKKEEEVSKRNPAEIVKELSYIKARDVFERGNRECVVIGADTIVVYNEQIMGKPKDDEDAYFMLHLIQGEIHQVYTGVTIIWKSDDSVHVASFYEKTDVNVYHMSDEEIKTYIATKEPMDKAGAYGIQGAFAAFVKDIHGDYNNVVGLPIGRVYQELKNQNLI